MVLTTYPVRGGGVGLPLRGDMVVSNLFRVKFASPKLAVGTFSHCTALPLVKLFNNSVLELGTGIASQGRSLTLADNVVR